MSPISPETPTKVPEPTSGSVERSNKIERIELWITA